MSDIMLDTDGDIMATQIGDIRIISNDDELIQMAVNNMSTIYGELENDLTRGNLVYSRRIKINNEGMRKVAYDCKNAILQDPRVVNVPYIDVTKTEGSDYGCTVKFNITKKDGSVIEGSTAINIGKG